MKPHATHATEPGSLLCEFYQYRGHSADTCGEVSRGTHQVGYSGLHQTPHRLYALGRMVDVLLYNLARIHDLWPILLDHLIELLADAKPGVRASAVDAAGRALAGRSQAASAPTSRHAFKEPPLP